MTELFPRPKDPPTIFGGLVLIGAVIVIGAVSIYVFGSHADSTLTIILVAIGLILIASAIPVHKWERNQNYQGKKKIQLNLRVLTHCFFQLASFRIRLYRAHTARETYVASLDGHPTILVFFA